MPLRAPLAAVIPAGLSQIAAVTLQEDIDSFKDCITKAESERDAWRVAGREEKYLEAYFLAEALELQLEGRLKRRTADEVPC